ncbi:MAG TPA: DUF4411 family protein [Longilinea sp.]|nr:DUF4411 family protein [Longilinea sp.]
MEYCLDTSVYIQAYRTYYAFDIAPPFWAALEKLAVDGVIVSPIAVYVEINKGKDDLARWAKNQRDTLFIEPDDLVNTALHQIADFANERYLDAHWIRDFLGGADPWVVAQAKAHNLIVVTMEGQKTTEEIDKSTNRVHGKIKIPNMCGHFGVKCMTTFDLLRTLKIGF